jgi:GxxExxY protein
LEFFLALTRVVIGCSIEVHKVLGSGFFESVYEKALSREFEIKNLRFRRQVPVPVYYKDSPVGHCIVDMVVENKLLLELKALDRIAPVHEAQLVQYLCATGLEVGLILNFGARSLQIKRVLNGFGPGTQI